MKKPTRAFLASKAVARKKKTVKSKHSKPLTQATISGPSGCGKSTLVLNMAEAACSHGQTVAYFDVDIGLTPSMLTGCGLDLYNGNSFAAYQVNSGEAILEQAIKIMPVVDVIAIDTLSNLVPASLLEKSVEDFQSWDEFHQAQNHLIKTLKREAEKHNVTIIVTTNRKVVYNYGGGCYHPADWFAALSDIHVEISRGKDIAPQAIDEHGHPRFIIDDKGIHAIPDDTGMTGWKSMLGVYHRTDPRQYSLDCVFHNFYLGSGFRLDFSQRRLLNLLLTEVRDTQDQISEEIL